MIIASLNASDTIITTNDNDDNGNYGIIFNNQDSIIITIVNIDNRI